MAKAEWNSVMLAESDRTVRVEGNHYFPPNSLNWEYFESSDRHTTCFWKGKASYYHVQVNGERIDNAAGIYRQPSNAAQEIKDYVAFYANRVQILG